MAKARLQVAEPAPIELILSNKEAQALFAVLMNIGGDPCESRRGIIDGIRIAMAKVDSKRFNDTVPSRFDMAGSLKFMSVGKTMSSCPIGRCEGD